MTIRILTIPDDPAMWAGWLEQQLVGPHLRELIDELRMNPALSGTKAVSLNEILTADELRVCRRSGLKSLGIEKVQQLLGCPDALLELQEHLLINARGHWRSLPVDPELIQSTEATWHKLSKSLELTPRPEVASDKSGDCGAGFQPATYSGSRSTRGPRQLAVWLTSAAVLMLAVSLFWDRSPKPSGRVLGTPGLLATQESDTSIEYLRRIASAGKTWFDQHPRNAEQLAALLEEVSQDCQILIDAAHPALSEAERSTFVTRCSKWKSDFDATLASLRSGQLGFDEACLRADKTMTRLIEVLESGLAG